MTARHHDAATQIRAVPPEEWEIRWSDVWRWGNSHEWTPLFPSTEHPLVPRLIAVADEIAVDLVKSGYGTHVLMRAFEFADGAHDQEPMLTAMEEAMECMGTHAGLALKDEFGNPPTVQQLRDCTTADQVDEWYIDASSFGVTIETSIRNLARLSVFSQPETYLLADEVPVELLRPLFCDQGGAMDPDVLRSILRDQLMFPLLKESSVARAKEHAKLLTSETGGDFVEWGINVARERAWLATSPDAASRLPARMQQARERVEAPFVQDVQAEFRVQTWRLGADAKTKLDVSDPQRNRRWIARANRLEPLWRPIIDGWLERTGTGKSSDEAAFEWASSRISGTFPEALRHEALELAKEHLKVRDHELRANRSARALATTLAAQELLMLRGKMTPREIVKKRKSLEQEKG